MDNYNKVFKTEQEIKWSSDFGDKYFYRVQEKKKEAIPGNISIFSEILSKTYKVKTIIEYGANVGLNLIAINQLLPDIDLTAVEINQKAFNQLKNNKFIKKAYNKSIIDFIPSEKFDLCFTKGVLIHINPSSLEKVYKLLYESSNKYILVAEYYNPFPVEVSYQDESRMLYKRDFAGELIDKYPDLGLVDYGFRYHRDKYFPRDDITWFLLQKM